MINVAHVDHSSDPGGAELALVRALSSSSVWVPLLCLPGRAGDSLGVFSETVLGGVRLLRVGPRQPPGVANAKNRVALATTLVRVAGYAVALRLSSRFRAVDVVHANTSRAAVVAYLATVASRRRFVVHLRDDWTSQALGRGGARLLAAAVRGADGVIANSAYTLSTFETVLPPDTKTTVLPSPLGHRVGAPVSVRHTTTRIGMLARLADWKGQELLISAFATAFRDGEEILELAGSPAFGESSYLNRLRELVKELGIQERVKFLGHVDDVWSVLDSWDVCVHCSLRPEPLGQNVLQYLVACRPTIASAEGGPAEWISNGKTGVLVAPRDVDRLVEALLTLARDYPTRKMLSENLERLRPIPSDDRLNTAMGAFFATVAGGQRRRGRLKRSR